MSTSGEPGVCMALHQPSQQWWLTASWGSRHTFRTVKTIPLSTCPCPRHLSPGLLKSLIVFSAFCHLPEPNSQSINSLVARRGILFTVPPSLGWRSHVVCLLWCFRSFTTSPGLPIFLSSSTAFFPHSFPPASMPLPLPEYQALYKPSPCVSQHLPCPKSFILFLVEEFILLTRDEYVLNILGQSLLHIILILF
jgi:hypothetical protein